jgi:hypothetical protein
MIRKVYEADTTEGRIEQHPGPLIGEDDEYPDLARLAFAFNRRNVGTLRLLVNDVNAA